MRAFATIVVSALLAPAIATQVPQAEPARVVRENIPRQTGTGGEQPDNLLNSLLNLANAFDLTMCVPGAISLVPELPQIPPGLLNNEVITQVLSQTTLKSDQICSFSITGSAGSQVTSFLPTWYSWYSAHSTQIQSIITKYGCTKATSLVHTVEDYQTCPAVSGIIVSGVTAAPSSTRPASNSATTTRSNSSRSTSSSASTVVPNVASRQTGLGAAAAAVVGFAGLAIAL